MNLSQRNCDPWINPRVRQVHPKAFVDMGKPTLVQVYLKTSVAMDKAILDHLKVAVDKTMMQEMCPSRDCSP